jgi:YfdX protein
MAKPDAKLIALMIPGLCLVSNSACSRSPRSSVVEASSSAPAAPTPETPEPKSMEEQSVEPQVESEIEKMEAERRAALLQDAESSIAETRNALAALDQGDKAAALSALQRASGKLSMIVSRDPKLVFAPIDVSTSVIDLYASPDTVKRVVNDAKTQLGNGQVQVARRLVSNLASEANLNVVGVPLGTYPAAIRAAAPLIDAGKLAEAKVALQTALHTLVIQTYVIPLPRLRAQALLSRAEDIAAKSSRTPDDNNQLHNLVESSRNELRLAEALGYGNKDDYKPLYAQLDEVQKKTENGQSGRSLFDKIEQSLRNFKFSS